MALTDLQRLIWSIKIERVETVTALTLVIFDVQSLMAVEVDLAVGRPTAQTELVL